MDEKFHSLLERAEGHASAWIETIAERPVRATRSSDELRQLLGGPLAQQALDPEIVTATLANAALGGTVASTGPRFFGFVVGGRLPAALAADWLVSTWDQNACVYAQSPLVSVIEQITGSWLLEIAGLSPGMSFGFVTGCQMASFTGLAAARHRVLRRAGWDVEANGLCGAPPIEVVVSEEAHYTIFMALRLLGIGTAQVRRIPTDDQGRMRADELGKFLHARKNGPCIVCAQAGNVNTGAFDPLAAIAEQTRAAGAWLHVDGAFGLWAAAAPARAHLLAGSELADSWATDAHKWLNVPYDCGLAFVRDPHALQAAMAITAEYLPTQTEQRNPSDFTPELSRRARGVEVWAALRSLGRAGLADMIGRNCVQARRFAEKLRAGGCEILNDVVLNQVLVAFGDAEKTKRVIQAIQDDGTCWAGITVWQGRTAMRISVSSWATTEADVDQSVAAMLRAARA